MALSDLDVNDALQYVKPNNSMSGYPGLTGNSAGYKQDSPGKFFNLCRLPFHWQKQGQDHGIVEGTELESRNLLVFG